MELQTKYVQSEWGCANSRITFAGVSTGSKRVQCATALAAGINEDFTAAPRERLPPAGQPPPRV